MTPTRAERKHAEHWRGVRSRIMVEFSDVLAVVLVAAFLWLTWAVVTGQADVEVLRVYIPVMSIVVAGYFGEAAIREWQRGDPKSPRRLPEEQGGPPI